MSEVASTDKCTGLISADFARRFAQEWVAAWNLHDLDRVLEHYADNFEMHSASIIAIAGEPSGILRGKDKVRTYWAAALKALPDLKFELIDVYAGIGSIAINYRSIGRYIVTEVLEFDPDCKAVRGSALHRQTESG